MPPLLNTVLVIEGTLGASAALEKALADAGLSVQLAATLPEALQTLASSPVRVVVVGLDLLSTEGASVLLQLRAGQEYHRCLLAVLADDAVQSRVAALAAGADDALSSPWTREELVLRVQRLFGESARSDELKRQLVEVSRLALEDSLTQAATARVFLDRLKEEFRRAQRYDDPLALILLDLDRLRELNERHGHRTGDESLCAVSTALRSAIRDTDLVARHTAGAFALLLPKTPLGGALSVGERVWKDVAALRVAPLVRLTASVGISGFPHGQVVSSEQLLESADEALRRAKRDGRNRVALYQPARFFADSNG